MIERMLAPIFRPRFGMVFLTAVASILMMFHWLPLGLPGAVVVLLALFRPQIAVRSSTWWLVAVIWVVAVVVVRHRLEDHVYLLTAWLVALAIVLGHQDEERFIAAAAWQARVLIGVTFAAAVGWKVYFTEFLTGTSLWLYLILDGRFRPLANVLGLSEEHRQHDQAALAELLSGDVAMVSAVAPDAVLYRITAVALAALLLEAVVAVAHLAGDQTRVAKLRLPSLVLFATVTYAVVPVVLFAVPLAVLAMATQWWRREVIWVFPVLVLVSGTRLATLIL